jgi:hydroxymethylpyrimidine/phosphomethylpyrimidine kinase
VCGCRSGIDARPAPAEYEAAELYAFGPPARLVKGGHWRTTDVCVDLHYDGHTFTELPRTAFTTGNTHGGGDTTPRPSRPAPAQRAAGGPERVALAKRFVVGRRRPASRLPTPRGRGPVFPCGRSVPGGADAD